MNILCDTCSVLMLIRIAPDMFLDKKFNCVTVLEVRKELIQTQKFKTKYPWKNDYKAKFQYSSFIVDKGKEFSLNFETVIQLIDAFIINIKTDRTFELSLVDKKIASYCITYNLELSSTDNDLIDFLDQEFDKKNKFPLGIVNDWIQQKLIVWNDEHQRIIEDWQSHDEPNQPIEDIREFERLTGFKYLGT